MNHLYKWLTGLSTAIISSMPSWQPVVNRGCIGSCSACGVSCLLLPFLLVWLLIVAGVQKLQNLQVTDNGN